MYTYVTYRHAKVKPRRPKLSESVASIVDFFSSATVAGVLILFCKSSTAAKLLSGSRISFSICRVSGSEGHGARFREKGLSGLMVFQHVGPCAACARFVRK